MPVLLFLLLLFSSSVFAQDSATVKKLSRYSSILKEERFIEVYVPASGNKSEVIYVLDGQAQFTNVVNALKQAGQTQKIVVGVGNIWLRDRDYTPTHVESSPFLDKRAAEVSGGGPRFIAYLEKELIPYIDSNYATGKSRILIGHSFGGLISVDILLNHTHLFDKYIIIDPAMWWDSSKIAKQSGELMKNIAQPKKIFIAIANTMYKDMVDLEAIVKDTTKNTELIRPSVLLLFYMNRNKDRFIFESKYYKEEDHMSVFVPAVNDGLRFILK